ncbi:MAG: hypothetical protein Q8M92_09740 [Candidatus Subteraquimicrobiales bacterium]|nr:hypothetical protein [Candidatus Subteraquimicrobiales bacterium]
MTKKTARLPALSADRHGGRHGNDDIKGSRNYAKMCSFWLLFNSLEIKSKKWKKGNA